MSDLIFTGAIEFEDACQPAAGKTDWGVDTLKRQMQGGYTKLAAFLAGLVQGQTFTSNGVQFFLQSWDPDDAKIFPTVTLFYKGFLTGLPRPSANGEYAQQTVSVSKDFGDGGINCGSWGTVQTATREIQYVAPQTVWKYISQGLPTTPRYSVNASGPPTILQSVITATTTDGKQVRFTGDVAPDGLVSALSPALINLTIGPRTSPIYGSPYYECEETGTQIYKGS